MTHTSCAQSEAEYRATEERMKKEWTPERAQQEQMRDWKIPGWLNAPHPTGPTGCSSAGTAAGCLLRIVPTCIAMAS